MLSPFFSLAIRSERMLFRQPQSIYGLLIVLLLFSCDQEEKAFTPLDSSATNIEFENIPASYEDLNILYYIYYYNGAGVATGDLNNDGLEDIFFAANDRGKNRLYLNKGNLKFEDISVAAGIAGISDWCTGVTMADVNSDGFLDIYVCAVSNKHSLKGFNQLFINNQNNTFTESAERYGLNFSGYSTQSVFFDYDHDGDLDCYLLNQSDRPHQRIVDTSYRRRFDPNAGDRLYRNEMISGSRENSKGDIKFSDVSAQAGIYQSSLGYGLGLAVADVNNDGWEDIYIGNDFHENDYYYINNRNGTFSEGGAAVFGHYSRFSMGNDIADYNNDGNLDILTVDMLPDKEQILKTYGSDERADIYNFKIIKNGYQPQFSRNCLQRNNGNGSNFSDVALVSGVSATDWSWSPLMADFDNDGFKDIFISSGIVQRPVDLDYIRFVSALANERGTRITDNADASALEKMPEGSSYCFLFQGTDTGNFADKSADWGIAHKKGFFTGAAYSDLDNDGDLDIVVNPVRSKSFIYRNNSLGKNYLQLKFSGGASNWFGVGVKAYLFQPGKLQYQQLMLTRGFQSSSSPRLHFGLDTIAIDSLLIVWPDSAYQVLKNLSANKLLSIDKSSANGKFIKDDFFATGVESLSAVPSLIPGDGFKHNEDRFDDFSAQYLIPHSLSRRGPKLAVADINKDGLDDFYVCAPIGQAGQLFIQNAKGRFIESDTTVFSKESMCEDTDAIFTDVNGDGYDDLYVTSGGNVYKHNNPYLADRLYMNDGKGHFKKAESSLPSILTNKSCVAAGDIDGDKDIDLFVGTLAEPQSYGVPQTSFLLLNNGSGVFTAAGDQTIQLKDLGMVTSAAFSDLNSDGKLDLVVAGEWMPLTFFYNKNNTFSPVKQSESSGLWQCLFLTDVNSDGFTDVVAGNWGINSKLAAGKNGPLRLYVNDFDNNGTKDPVLTYTINGKEFTFLPKDELEQVLPVLKKKYLYYTDFAGKTVTEIFNVGPEDQGVLEVHDLASAIFMSDGKGKFARVNLPMDLQLTPIFCFARSGKTNSWFAGGNFYGVLPYEGQYDAASLVSFELVKSDINRAKVLDIKGEVRDMKWIRTAIDGDVLVVAKNNERLQFYKVP